jgi:hypothetical protein
MFPVMLAVNTLPSPSTLTASTSPVVTDNSSSKPGRGEVDGLPDSDIACSSLVLKSEIAFEADHGDAVSGPGLADESSW